MKYIFKKINLLFICILSEIILFIMLITGLCNLSPYIFYAMTFLGICCAFFIATGEDNAVYRLTWIIPLLLFPAIFGAVFIFYNRRKTGRLIESNLLASGKRAAQYLKRTYADISGRNKLTADYIEKVVGFPPSNAGDAVYFPSGESFNEALIEALKGAQKYIFIEIFILEQGVMWDEILYILSEKAVQGLDIRFIYDGTGSAYTIPYDYYKQLRRLGIKCVVFNPYRSLLSVRCNISNHRKVISIDGKIAFSGGLNFADEYINRKPSADTGHWKDSAVMIKNDAAWNFTLMFLVMWEFVSRKKVNFGDFMPVKEEQCMTETAASVWCDIPLDNAPVSERLYLNLIMRAEDYLHITTPYLIPPDEILSALCLSAESGVDVRIILPFIPDKYMVHTVTKTYYSPLLEAGVKIYEYAPGFIHAKNLVADGKVASVGSLNLDFRSLYMNFECGVCFYDADIIKDIENDFIKTLNSCKEITLADYRLTKAARRFFRRACRILAPFL